MALPSVFNSALAAPIVMRSASLIRQIFRSPMSGRYMIWCSISRTCSILICWVACSGSGSMTKKSGCVRASICWQDRHAPQLSRPVRLGRLFAVERLREANGRQSFSNRLLAVEQIGVSQTLVVTAACRRAMDC